MSHCQWLEIFWRILPARVLVLLGFPSVKLLYRTERFNYNANLTLKIEGHQWFWEYSIPEYQLRFERYPLSLVKIFRLLETSTRVCIPLNTSIRVIITSFDVLHSWALPRVAVKIDACPGRLNFIVLHFSKPGTYTGQCRELCGRLHYIIPIYVESVSSSLFMRWLKLKL